MSNLYSEKAHPSSIYTRLNTRCVIHLFSYSITMKSNKDDKTWISNILVRNNSLCLKQIYCCLTCVCMYITEASLNAINNNNICSIPSKFLMWMYDRIKYISIQYQRSIPISCVWKAVLNRTFWKTFVYQLIHILAFTWKQTCLRWAS